AGSFNEIALKYVLQHPAVVSAVFGASSSEQVETNVNLNIHHRLSDQLYGQIQSLTTPNVYTNHR
ncbi:MAG TPA: aldo/keto reductase, partial [Candidatus Avamphibacillus intestinigallinarum]|nr:aldo/keto reductase [Candidatus Avamphibacillus intestinigallinarum]